MDRRAMLGMLGTGAVGVALTSTEVFAQDPHDAHKAMHTKMAESCLKACSDCAKSCDETFHHCMMLLAKGEKEHALSAHLLSDCAGFCGLSACMIAKHSPLMAHSCMACAEACKATAAEVDKFDMPQMKMTAKMLMACEKSCREMVAAMAHNHG